VRRGPGLSGDKIPLLAGFLLLLSEKNLIFKILTLIGHGTEGAELYQTGVCMANFTSSLRNGHKAKLVRLILPYFAEVVTRLPFNQKLSLILDQLVVYAEI
jgi:hypothetical protein